MFPVRETPCTRLRTSGHSPEVYAPKGHEACGSSYLPYFPSLHFFLQINVPLSLSLCASFLLSIPFLCFCPTSWFFQSAPLFPNFFLLLPGPQACFCILFVCFLSPSFPCPHTSFFIPVSFLLPPPSPHFLSHHPFSPADPSFPLLRLSLRSGAVSPPPQPPCPCPCPAHARYPRGPAGTPGRMCAAASPPLPLRAARFGWASASPCLGRAKASAVPGMAPLPLGGGTPSTAAGSTPAWGGPAESGAAAAGARRGAEGRRRDVLCWREPGSGKDVPAALCQHIATRSLSLQTPPH